jgi:mannose-1-phosphate guanylyltransferase
MSDAPRAPDVNKDRQWALVLAAGEGSRLRALTTQPCGTPVPKQYCSLHGAQSLVEDAIRRAQSQVAADRVCAIVAQLPARNLIVQPRNRGTAIGILYSLIHILHLDPDAQVLLIPSDHYVADEGVLAGALAAARSHVAQLPDRPVLLGLHPDEADTELGYIVPGVPDTHGGLSVARFVEKPDHTTAAQIVRAGGLWNTFIIAASARSLLNMFLPRFAPIVMEMQVIVGSALQIKSSAAGWPAIVDMYTRLPDLDFSRHLLEGRESALCVVPVPACGWSDLGTPHRVGETLRRLPRQSGLGASGRPSGSINLAAQHAHFERSLAGASL